jgi:FkbM family methyltransferase
MIKFLIKFPLLKRIIPSIYKKYILVTGNFLKKKKIHGIEYILDTRHLIDRNFYLRENYEDELFFWAINLITLNKINIFLDIGSCWGIYSLRLSKIKKLKIFSFDPIIKNIKRLDEMIKINRIKNIKTFDTALGNQKKKIKFYGLEDYTPNYTLYGKNEKNIAICNIDKLDNIIKIKKNVLYLKVDIEGSEYPFLLGSKNIFKNNNVIMQIEIFKKNKKKIFNFFQKNNFNCIFESKSDYIFSNFKTKNPQKFLSEGF